MRRFLKEFVLLIIATVPFVYLAMIWAELPQQLPTHFGLDGTPNDWTAKSSFPYLIACMGYGTYLLMLLIPYFDPKNKIEQMGDKYYSFRFILALLMSAMSFYILFTSLESKMNPNLLFGLIAAFYVLLGNYFQTLKPNYFIGIKTPWALENEDNWRKTHRLAGKMWLAGGLLIVLLTFIIKDAKVMGTIFLAVTLIISLVPFGYSYLEFRKCQRHKD